MFNLWIDEPSITDISMEKISRFKNFENESIALAKF